MPRLFGRRRTGELEQRALAPPTLPGPHGYPAPSPSPQNATAISDAFACVRALAEAALSVPLIAYRRTDTGRVRAGDRSLISQLLEAPAPGATQSALIGTVMAHLNLYGNAYIGKYREGADIVAIGAISPDQMVVELQGGEPRYTYSPHTGEPTQELTRRDVIHVHAISVDGLEGLSPIRQARRALALSAQLQAHAESFFENDARPAGILRLNRFGDVDAQVEELRTAFEAQHRGQPHRIAVVRGDVAFEALSMPLDDAQFLEQRKLSAVEVARIFRVPPRMIAADPGYSMTYSNAESEAIEFVTYALRPWLVALQQAISADRDLCPGGLYVQFLLDELLRADHAARAAFYTAALNPQTGWMTRAEVRERENLEPEPAGSEPPSSMLTNGQPPAGPLAIPPPMPPASVGG